MDLQEGIAVGRSFSMFKNYHIDGNKEMIAFGTMNIVGSFTSCYLTTGTNSIKHNLSPFSLCLVCFPKQGLNNQSLCILHWKIQGHFRDPRWTTMQDAKRQCRTSSWQLPSCSLCYSSHPYSITLHSLFSQPSLYLQCLASLIMKPPSIFGRSTSSTSLCAWVPMLVWFLAVSKLV